MSESAQAATFQIEKIFIKDLSLEIPHAPQVFLQPQQPAIEVHIDSGAAQFADGLYQVTVSATVTARAGDSVMFLAEVVQAGIFQLRNVPPEELGPLLGIACPNILFPYVREAVSDMVTRGGFPPVLLNPISFEQLYLQRLQGQAGAPAENGGGPRIEVAG